jgi:DNA (cytosine-5)-methyltransferase 1
MFAGVGGVALGFINAGFDVGWSNEFDSNACKTYKANFPHHTLIEQDVNTLDTSEVSGVDIITSGFPCQAFSIAGRREGFNDTSGRGNLFFETARFIEELQPRAFLLENVKNLKSHDKGRTFAIIKDHIENKLGYSFIYFVLNGCLHGNVPQNRERVYMIGFRGEAGAPKYDNQTSLFNLNKENSLTSMFKEPNQVDLKLTVKDVVDWRRKDKKYYFNKDHKYMPELEKVIVSRDTLYQWRRTHVRANKSGVCPTLTANMGGGGHNVPLLKDSWGYRRLVPRECFRFQGFPEDFILPEDVADSQLYKQAGNSVVVPIITRIAKAIKDVLIHADRKMDDRKTQRWQTYRA